MNNQSQITVRDFQEYNAEVTGLLLPIHNGTILLIIWISFKVQKAVFKTLDRLGSRHINTIIKTNLVILHDLLMLLMCVIILFFKVSINKNPILDTEFSPNYYFLRLKFLFLDNVSHIHSLPTILRNEGSILSLKGPIW